MTKSEQRKLEELVLGSIGLFLLGLHLVDNAGDVFWSVVVVLPPIYICIRAARRMTRFKNRHGGKISKGDRDKKAERICNRACLEIVLWWVLAVYWFGWRLWLVNHGLVEDWRYRFSVMTGGLIGAFIPLGLMNYWHYLELKETHRKGESEQDV